MEFLAAIFGFIMEILRRPIYFGGVKFSLLGLMMISIGGVLINIVLRAIFSDD